MQFFCLSLSGQEIKKRSVTPDDYKTWQYLGVGDMSGNGQWLSYSMHYESGVDTLYIKSTKSLKTVTFPGGKRGAFINQDWFTYYSSEGLNLVNLKTWKQEVVPNVAYHVYATRSKKLVIFIQHGSENELIVRSVEGALKQRIPDVKEFLLDPTESRVLYTKATGNQFFIGLLDISQKDQNNILMSGPNSFHNLTWQTQGKALAFMQKTAPESKSNTLHFFDLSGKKFNQLNSTKQQGFLGDTLNIASGIKLKISDDMQRVIFLAKQKPKVKDSLPGSDVQIWNGNAKLMYPKQEAQKRNERTYYALWEPFEDRYRMITNDSLPQFMLTGNQKFALLSNPYEYEPQYAEVGPRDYYLLDLISGNSSLFLKKHPGSFLYITPSPSGKYVAYFHQKNWWVYTIEKKTHVNITQNIARSFFHNSNEHPKGSDQPYIILGWTPNDKQLLVRDEYDIWAVNSDGTSSRRLTQGRENETRFKVAGSSFHVPARVNYNGLMFDIVDLDKGLLLETVNEQKQYGYYRWTPKSNQKMVFSTHTRLDQPFIAKDGQTFVYTEQRYDLPPRLMLKTKSDEAAKIIVQSNPQQEQFYWGKSELIQYKNSNGKALQGILFYPAGYDKKKKYPMIVYIYEKLSAGLHHGYINPSQFRGTDDGFNISSFTTQGYFVLAPDISYEIGDPGISATDCVVSAVNDVRSKSMVLPDRIGLIGHSFGGYETDFIITQTKLFAAAVAGAAASTDLTSDYLSIGKSSGRPEMWRFESQQMRMGKSLFDDRAAYDRNSPVVHAKNIKTPLLSWTGDADPQVDWNQSLEYYLALHRLEKKHIMLVYPKEGHTLTNQKNWNDLSVRIHEWFDYHLKGEKPADWIAKGTGVVQ